MNYLKKTMLGGLCALTLAGSFYGTKTLLDHLLPEQKIEQNHNKTEVNKFKEVLGSLGKLVQNIENAVFCNHEIKPKHTREQIEEIVNSVNTPGEAFEKIREDITFSYAGDWLSGCLLGCYRSLQETYALGNGDCSEGAVSFAAMLSDNPEYDVQIVFLPPKEGKIWGHMAALFTEEGKWGLVSFNDINGEENRSVFYPAEYNSIDEAVTDLCSEEYEQYTLVHFTPEELKFGKALQYKQFNLQWQPIKSE